MANLDDFRALKSSQSFPIETDMAYTGNCAPVLADDHPLCGGVFVSCWNWTNRLFKRVTEQIADRSGDPRGGLILLDLENMVWKRVEYPEGARRMVTAWNYYSAGMISPKNNADRRGADDYNEDSDLESAGRPHSLQRR